MADTWRPGTDRRFDEREDRDRGWGSQRDLPKGLSQDGPSSTHLPPRIPERSRTWDNSRDQSNASNRDPPSSGHGTNTGASSKGQDDLFPAKVPPKTIRGNKPVLKTAVTSPPEPTDLRGRLRDKLKIEGELKDLYSRRDASNKERATAQSQITKYNRAPTDFPKFVGIHYRTQQSKCNDDLKAIDAQIKEKENRFMSLYARLYPQQASNDSSPGYSSPLDDNNAERENLNARLASQEESFKKALAEHKSVLEQTLTATLDQYKSQMQTLASNSQKDLSAMAQTYEAQISKLTEALETESNKTAVLEQKLIESEGKIQELGQAVARPPGNCVLAEENAIDLARIEVSYQAKIPHLDRLAKRVSELESSLSRLDKNAEFLEESNSARQQMVKDVQALNDAVALNQGEIANLPLGALRNLPTELASLKQMVQQQLEQQVGQVPAMLVAGTPVQLQSPSGSSRGTPDLPQPMEKWMQQMEAETRHQKAELRKKVNEIGPFMQGERIKREELETLLDNRIKALDARVEKLEAGQGQTDEQLAAIRGKISFDLSDHGDKIARIHHRLDGQDQDFKSQWSLVHTQLQSLDAWQSNFSTKLLYRDIVTHINATVPDSLPKVVSALSSKVGLLEAQMQMTDKRRLDATHDDPSKRRRVGEGHMTLRQA